MPAVYAGFIIINTVAPKLMGKQVIFGLNLAVTYGFGLIILAVIAGLIYNAICTKKEDELAALEGEQEAEKMIYNASLMPILLFLTIVISVLTISILSARKSSSVKGYFAAGGTIPWDCQRYCFCRRLSVRRPHSWASAE